MDNISNIVKINVEGTIFETQLDTLLVIPYFNNLFKDTSPDLNVPIFLDQSSKGFSHVLRWARNPDHKFPIKYKRDFDFYLIEYTDDNIYDIHNDIKLLSSKINILTDRVDKTGHAIYDVSQNVQRIKLKCSKLDQISNKSCNKSCDKQFDNQWYK